MDTDKIGDRVLTIRKTNKLTQEDFSKLTGITRSYLAAVEKNRKEPSFNFIMSIVDTIEVDADWFLKGKGQIFKEEKDQTPKWFTSCGKRQTMNIAPG
jgi:transcriptional regulator with XRE-family HTH domain